MHIEIIHFKVDVAIFLAVSVFCSKVGIGPCWFGLAAGMRRWKINPGGEKAVQYMT